MTVDNQLQRMMRDLGHALVKAIATSPEVGDVVRKIHQQGYSLYLVLDRDKDNGTQIELTPTQAPARKPAFLLNKGDVNLLESLGIDATRPGRRRRSPF